MAVPCSRREFFVRVTDQMINRMAEKSGLPIHSNKGMNSSDNSLLSALNKKSSTTAYDKMKTKSNFQTLTKDANSLHDTANLFTTEEGKDSIYSKAAESQDMSEIVSGAQKIADGYNKILSGLKESSSVLNDLYLTELQKVADEQDQYLIEVGITRDKAGKMSVDAEKLKVANLETLQRAMEPFADKVSFLSERIAANAKAESSSISSHYDQSGNLYSGSGSTYDFWS